MPQNQGEVRYIHHAAAAYRTAYSRNSRIKWKNWGPKHWNDILLHSILYYAADWLKWTTQAELSSCTALNPKPYTLNPKPYTLKHKPYTYGLRTELSEAPPKLPSPAFLR